MLVGDAACFEWRIRTKRRNLRVDAGGRTCPSNDRVTRQDTADTSCQLTLSGATPLAPASKQAYNDAMNGLRLGFLWLCLSLTGCAALPKGSVILTHTPLLPVGTIQTRATLEILTDQRPEEELRAMRNIPHLNEQVTSLFLQDLRQAKLFSSLEFPADPTQVDVIIRGEIRSLRWRSKWYPITFIPYLNLITLLGFPAGNNEGGVRLFIEAVNAHTGAVIASHEQSSGSSRTYSIYQATDYRVAGGEETREALRTVIDDLKAALWGDRRLIEAAASATAP